MKSILLSTIVVFGLTGAIKAENLSTGSEDWGGFYGGGMVSYNSGQATLLYSGSGYFPDDFTNAASAGAFIGYNFQRGALVYGAELALTAANLSVTAPSGFNGTQTYFGDAKFRLGYSFGRVIVYGVGGVSAGSFTEGGPDIYSQVGFVYGVGADVMVSDNLFLGVEYTSRKMNGQHPIHSGTSIDSNIESIALRAGWRF